MTSEKKYNIVEMFLNNKDFDKIDDIYNYLVNGDDKSYYNYLERNDVIDPIYNNSNVIKSLRK